MLMISGKRDHHHRWVTRQCIEKAEWRQIDCTIGMDGADPGNRSWHDAAFEWVVRQAMLLVGFIKHGLLAKLSNRRN